MATIDDLKSIATTRLGFARQNSFLVTLPSRFGTDPKELNILCSRATLPQKSIITSDRLIGTELQKVPYGYQVPETSLTFYLMNDYGVKKYFDNWRQAIIDDETLQIQYKDTFIEDVEIHQLRKPLLGFSKSVGPFRAGVQIGGGTVYSVKLIDAFPLSVGEVILENGANDAIIEFTVTLSFTNWKVTRSPQDFITGSFNIGQAFG